MEQYLLCKQNRVRPVSREAVTFPVGYAVNGYGLGVTLNVTVEPVNHGHRPHILEMLQRVLAADPWWVHDVNANDLAAVSEWFDQKHTNKAWVALHDGRVVGHAAVKFHDAPDGRFGGTGGEVARVFTDPDFRSMGVASLLANTLVDWAEQSGYGLWLNCVAGSPSHTFWQRLEWIEVSDHVYPVEVERRLGKIMIHH